MPITHFVKNPDTLHWQVMTYAYKWLQFALCVEKSGEYWQFTVVMFACPETCSLFTIEMEVYESDSPAGSKRRLAGKVCCHPCSIDQPVAEMKGLGLCVHHRLMEWMMLKEDSFKFTVSFSFL